MIKLSHDNSSACIVDVELFLRVDSFVMKFESISPDLLIDLNNLIECLTLYEKIYIITHELSDFRYGPILQTFMDEGVIENIDPFDFSAAINLQSLDPFVDADALKALEINWSEADTYFDGARDDDRTAIDLFTREEMSAKDAELLFGAYPYLYNQFAKASSSGLPVNRSDVSLIVRNTMKKYGDVVGTRVLKRSAIMNGLSSFFGVQYMSDIGHSILDAFSSTKRIISPARDYSFLKHELSKLLREFIEWGMPLEAPLPPLTLLMFDHIRKVWDRNSGPLSSPFINFIKILREEAKDYRNCLANYVEKIQHPEEHTLEDLKKIKEETVETSIDLLRKTKFNTLDKTMFRDIFLATIKSEAPETIGGFMKTGFKTYEDIKIIVRNRWIFKVNNSLAKLRIQPNLLNDIFYKNTCSYREIVGIERMVNNIENLYFESVLSK